MPKFWKTEMGRMLAAKKYKAAMILVAFLIFLGSPTYASMNINNCTATQDLNVSGETYLLTNDITDTFSPCIMITFSNITLDCQGYTIDGSLNSSEYGISISWVYDVEPDNVTIKNCIVQNFTVRGIDASYTNLSKIINNTLINNYDNIFLDEEIYNLTIFNNTIIDAEDIGVQIKKDNFVNVSNNKINNNYYGIELQENSEINFIYNNFLNSTYKNVDWTFDSVGQIWNTTQQTGTRIYSAGTEIGGNYWTNSTANGYSDLCTDLLQDGFCDDPYDVEAGVACAAVADGLPACGNNTDWLPLSAFYVEPPCIQEWNCTAWGECIRGQQTRECTDLNQCQNETGKPATTQACLKGLPNATYNISSDCCPISTFYCTDNETLVQLWNTSQGLSWAVEDCEFGCDNTTETCMPPSGQQNLLLFGVIVAMCVLGALFWRWSRR